MLLRTPLPPLLLLPWLPAAAGPGAAAELWHPLTYAQGFDDHDPVACLGGQHGTPAAAECSTAAGAVRLRGCAMCLSYVETCFDRPGTRFATLPPECRLADGAGPVTVGVASGCTAGYSGCITGGSEVRVGSDGGLTMVEGFGGKKQWLLKLDGMVIAPEPAVLRYTVDAVDLLAAAGLTYILACVAVNRVVRKRRGWEVLPHAGFLRELGGLVADGVLFARRGSAPEGSTPLLTGSAAGSLQQVGTTAPPARPEGVEESRELKVELRRLGLPATGGKAELRARLEQAFRLGTPSAPSAAAR